MPDLIRHLRAALVALHREVGKPPYRVVEDHAARADIRLARSTIADLLAGSRVPREATVTAFLEALDQYRRRDDAPAGQPPIPAEWFDTAHLRRQFPEEYAQLIGVERDPENAEVETGARDRYNWGEAPNVEGFVGRSDELTEMTSWLRGRASLVSIEGVGGVGKTALAIQLAKQVSSEYQGLIWRSLRNAPPLTDLLGDLIQQCSQNGDPKPPTETDAQIALLIQRLQTRRMLVILDNLESVFEAGRVSGKYLTGFEGYGEFLRRAGEARHASSVIITTRQKPREIALLEGVNLQVRSWRLKGLDQDNGRELLEARGLTGPAGDVRSIAERYGGNPLALRLIANTIDELFGGRIQEFLAHDVTVFDDIRDILRQQINGLTAAEQRVILWLALSREPLPIKEIIPSVLPRSSPSTILDALRSLVRRSLVETADGLFTLQNVIMEYLIEEYVDQFSRELLRLHESTGDPLFPPAGDAEAPISILSSHPIIRATAKEYIRDAQERLILAPVTGRLLAALGSEKVVESQVRKDVQAVQRLTRRFDGAGPRVGYAAGNILNLLRSMGGDLTGLDFSGLPVWQAFLRGFPLHDVDFDGSDLTGCVFSETLASVFSVGLSPDGRRFVMGDNAGTVAIWDIAEHQKVVTTTGHSERVWRVAYSSDGKTIVSSSDDHTVKLWDAATGDCVQTFEGHTGWVRAAALSSDGRLVVSGSYDGTVKLWDARSGECLRTKTGHDGWVRSVCFSSDDQTILSGGMDSLIYAWRVSEDSEGIPLRGHDGAVFDVSVAPDGRLLASAGADQTVRLWDIARASCVAVLTGHTNEVHAVAFSADGARLASGGQDLGIKLWAVGSDDEPVCLTTIYGHTSWIWGLAFHPDHGRLLSGSADKSIRLWDVHDTTMVQCVDRWQGHSNWILSVAFSPDGRTIASGSSDHLLRVWDRERGDCALSVDAHDDQVTSVAFSPDGALLATGGWDGVAKLWDAHSGACVGTLSGHTSTPWSVSFSADGKFLATGGNDTLIKIWNVVTRETAETLTGHTAPIYAVQYSPQGDLLASGSFDSTVRLWDAESGRCRRVMHAAEGELITSIAFSPNGKQVASGSRNGALRIWNVETGRSFLLPRGHGGKMITCVGFHPDGRLLASGGGDGDVCLWDVVDRATVAVIPGDGQPVTGVSLEHNGSVFATGSHDGSVRVYSLDQRECIQEFRGKRLYEGMNIRSVTGLHEPQKVTLVTLGAVQ